MTISVASAGIIRGPWSICGGVQHHLSLKIVGDGGFFSDTVRPKSVTVVGMCPEQDSTWAQSHVQCFRFQKREMHQSRSVSCLQQAQCGTLSSFMCGFGHDRDRGRYRSDQD